MCYIVIDSYKQKKNEGEGIYMKKRICQIGGLLCSVVLLAVSVVPANVFAADKESI